MYTFRDVANEPSTSPIPLTPKTPQRVTRTFAQDVARLSGKPIPPSAQKPTAAPAKQTPITKQPEISEKKELVTSTPAPKPVATPPLPPRPAPEPPPAYIIPKAESTDETREDVLARLRAKVAKNQVTGPVLAPVSQAVKAPSTEESREAVLARLRGKARSASTPTVETPAPLPPVAAAVPEPERIHTYKSDFSEHIDDKSASTFSVLAAQADASTSDRVIFKERRRFPITLVVGILLILCGGSGIYAAYYFVTNKTVPVLVLNVPSLVTADEREEVSGTGATLLSSLRTLSEESLQEGRVRVAYTTSASTTPTGPIALPQGGGALIAALALPMPDILERSIQTESTVGAVHAGDEQRAFFVLRVDSFERAFAGMLAWEPTLQSDLAPLYPLFAEPATSTASTTEPIEPQFTAARPNFVDAIVGNRDVRILRDVRGATVMLYGFRDKETLIVARDEKAYQELVERLAATRGQ